jgi:peptidoglycan/LPS O-acetylase OafA/YrhL
MKYRPEVEGLRAFSVLPVIFYHMGVCWLPGGFVGVDIFL